MWEWSPGESGLPLPGDVTWALWWQCVAINDDSFMSTYVMVRLSSGWLQMRVLNAMKPPVQYFVFRKKSSEEVCAGFQCQDVHVDMDVCALQLEGLQRSQALPAFPGRGNSRSELK